MLLASGRVLPDGTAACAGQDGAPEDAAVGLDVPSTREMLLGQLPRTTKTTRGSRVQRSEVPDAPGCRLSPLQTSPAPF